MEIHVVLLIAVALIAIPVFALLRVSAKAVEINSRDDPSGG